MRIERVHLRAYGPFTDVVLDFSGRAGMHVVYGPNEAGKSTALRALTGLLYGIPTRTGDAHLHRMGDLRVGGTLVDEQGHRLSFVRRKGLKNTLSDEHGEPMDEALLRRMLGHHISGTRPHAAVRPGPVDDQELAAGLEYAPRLRDHVLLVRGLEEHVG